MYFVFYRMAQERELEKEDGLLNCNIIFDESGHLLLYSTMLGIKVVNLVSNLCVRIIGKPENLRLLHISLYQVFWIVCCGCYIFYYLH